MTGPNPFEWHGGAFLALYVFLFVGALIGGAAIAAWLRPEGFALPVTDEDELAVLAGGSDRLTETTIARLLARGAAIIDGSELTFAARAASFLPIEREIASLPSPATWPAIRRRVARAAERLEHQLARRGLLMERRAALQLGLFAALPVALLFGFGLIKLWLDLVRERPIGFLTAFLAVTAIAAQVRVFGTRRLTGSGADVLADARASSARLRLAPTLDEAGTAVALFGTAVLAGSQIAGLHRLRQPAVARFLSAVPRRARRRDKDGGCGPGGCGGGGFGDDEAGDSGCGGGGCGGCGGD